MPVHFSYSAFAHWPLTAPQLHTPRKPGWTLPTGYSSKPMLSSLLRSEKQSRTISRRMPYDFCLCDVETGRARCAQNGRQFVALDECMAFRAHARQRGCVTGVHGFAKKGGGPNPASGRLGLPSRRGCARAWETNRRKRPGFSGLRRDIRFRGSQGNESTWFLPLRANKGFIPSPRHTWINGGCLLQ
jgi:hypothetical protein